MIKFFRHIRQRLIKENRFNKYLMYALGEIVLVVIGILIALQINEWNAESKIEVSIAEHLKILRKDLREDQVQLLQLQKIMNENVHYADSAMMQKRTQLPVDGRMKLFLMKLMVEQQFSPNRNAMETITRSNELPHLTPDLQTLLLDYYALISRTRERELTSNTQIQTKYENWINQNYPEIFQKDNEWEFMSELYKDDPRPTTPISAEKLYADQYLEPLIASRYFQCQKLEEFYSELYDTVEDILAQLNEPS